MYTDCTDYTEKDSKVTEKNKKLKHEGHEEGAKKKLFIFSLRPFVVFVLKSFSPCNPRNSVFKKTYTLSKNNYELDK